MRIMEETRGRSIITPCSSMDDKWLSTMTWWFAVILIRELASAFYTHFAIPLRVQEYVPRQFICTVSSLQAMTNMSRCLFNHLSPLSAYYDISIRRCDGEQLSIGSRDISGCLLTCSRSSNISSHANISETTRKRRPTSKKMSCIWL